MVFSSDKKMFSWHTNGDCSCKEFTEDKPPRPVEDTLIVSGVFNCLDFTTTTTLTTTTETAGKITTTTSTETEGKITTTTTTETAVKITTTTSTETAGEITTTTTTETVNTFFPILCERIYFRTKAATFINF